MTDRTKGPLVVGTLAKDEDGNDIVKVKAKPSVFLQKVAYVDINFWRPPNLRDDPIAFANQYMQQPALEPWQKDAVKTITGWDIASPDGDWSVRWNDKIGRYERKRAGERRWEPM